MFESVCDEGPPAAGGSFEEDWFDPAWLEEAPWPEWIPEPEQAGRVPASRCVPSGWLALELEHGTVDPARLSDADLIDAVVGFDRVASWAGARQAMLLAEFARRRPGDSPPPTRSDTPARYSGYAPDEIALALRLSRTTAAGRVVLARTLIADLPGTLAAWEAGTIDVLKARAITETGYPLTPEQRGALEARVLPRAGQQTLSQLRAALARAVLAIDPDGAEDRYRRRRKDRRVVICPDEEGMASLWALLSAPDATAAYQRLCELARGLGAADSRGMDARRADLLVELLTGRRCAATGSCVDEDCDCPGDADCPGDTDRNAVPVPSGATASDTTASDTTASDTTASDTTASDTTASDTTAAGGAGFAGTGGGDTAGPDGVDRRSHRCGAIGGRGAGPGKPLVSVIVPITMLMGLDEQPGELVGYGPIPASLARRIAAEGTWRRLLTDPVSGTLLDYGRSTYTPPVGLADFVRARDLYCRNPICRQRAATADLDHTIAWADSGTTSEHNLSATCRHDHRLKTFAPGWHVDQHSDGQITWTTPTGHSYLSYPYDYRTDPPDRTHPPPAQPEIDKSGRCAGTPSDDDPPPF